MACERKHIVVLGAGFAGLATAHELAGGSTRVTVVDRNNFHTFQPLLYQVATSGLNAADVAHPVRGIFQGDENISFLNATVDGADLEAGRLHLHDAEEPLVLDFDQLVVAAGATTNSFDIPGVTEHGFPMYNLPEATALRNHVLERWESTDAHPELIDDGSLTFVVVGGGPTGVEVAGALVELFSMVLAKDFPHLDTNRARVILVEMRDELLATFSPASRRHARSTLTERGVEVRTGVRVEEVEPTRVRLVGGEEIAAHTLVWAAGVKATPLAVELGLPVDATGRIRVDRDLSVTGHPGIWAAGDIAAGVDPRHGEGPLPQLAPVAMQSGKHVARQVLRTIEGRPTAPFRYRDKGTMATIGRSRAVAELPLHIRLSGLPAWLAWLGLHLVMLAGFRNRVSVFCNWAWNWLTWDRGPRLILRSEPHPTSRVGSGR